MEHYISVVYSEKERPLTDYPQKLCDYLIQLFNISKGSKFLEVGCGRGEHLVLFKNAGLSVMGVDICEEAKRYHNDISIEICNVEKNNLPFENCSFDIVYSKSFIEHLCYPEFFFKEANRVLVPGGLLITLVPDWESNYKIYYDDFTHRTPFTKYSLRDIYTIHNFQKVEINIFRQLPIVWKYPVLNLFCSAISPFVPVRTKFKFLRWSRELMLLGSGYKSN